MTLSIHIAPKASIMISNPQPIHGERYFHSPPPRVSSNRRTNLQAYASTHPGPLDTVFDHDLGSVTGHTSSSRSSTISRNQGESFLTTKPSPVEGKTKRFPKFKFSLTAPPPKSKPKKPVESRPAVVSCPLFEVLGCRQRVYVVRS